MKIIFFEYLNQLYKNFLITEIRKQEINTKTYRKSSIKIVYRLLKNICVILIQYTVIKNIHSNNI